MIDVRRAEASDIPFLADCNCRMAWESEERKLDPDTARSGVEGLFQHPEYGFYVLAEDRGKLVGQLMITFEWSDWRNGLFWWIQSVFVLPEARRQGVYRTLHEYVRRIARHTPGVCGLRLYVDRNNSSARATYTRCGMAECRYDLFEELFPSPNGE